MPRRVFQVQDDWSSSPLTEVRCKDETNELQRLLELNLDLLPGDQINEENPRRWLLVRREMPVEDPNSGDARWSVDHFLVDQDAMPTLVECKRSLDPAARRQVVGQMLEYAANAHYYWTREQLREYAEQTAAKQGHTLEDALRSLGIDEPENTDGFFDRVVENLREGQLRLVFFIEDAPYELKSIVDFLNRQTERTEILIVEARQFESDGVHIVVPTVFGYTEQARRVKRSVATQSQTRRKWTEEAFFAELSQIIGEPKARKVQDCHDALIGLGYSSRLGTGKVTGSISYLAQEQFSRSILTIWSNGDLTIRLDWLNANPEEEARRKHLADIFQNTARIKIPDSYQIPSYRHDEWLDSRTDLIKAMEQARSLMSAAAEAVSAG